MNDEEDKKIDPSIEVIRDDSAESEEVVEFEYNADGEEDLKKTLKKLREDLKVIRKEKEEYLTGWQKERADFANYKKDEEERNSRLKILFQERILESFLSVLDSFNMAFANREVWEKVDSNWRKGVEYIYSQMNGVFEEYGVKSVGVEGEDFNPNFHESIELIPTDQKDKDHKIAVVIQKGYKLGERILRPARVNVFEFKE